MSAEGSASSHYEDANMEVPNGGEQEGETSISEEKELIVDAVDYEEYSGEENTDTYLADETYLCVMIKEEILLEDEDATIAATTPKARTNGEIHREKLLKIKKEVSDVLQKYRELTEDGEESMMILERDDIRGRTPEKILKQKEEQCINQKTIIALNKENNKCAKLKSQVKQKGETEKCASEIKNIKINGKIKQYAENNSQETCGKLNQCANKIQTTIQNGDVIQKIKTAVNKGINGYIKCRKDLFPTNLQNGDEHLKGLNNSDEIKRRRIIR